jgi:hypothetical protein
VATLGVVEVRRGPGMGARALARDLACSQGSGEAEPVPEGSGEAEPAPEGWGEPETFLAGPDRAATTLIIVLDGLRQMSFNSYFMGILILVPDKLLTSVALVDT